MRNSIIGRIGNDLSDTDTSYCTPISRYPISRWHYRCTLTAYPCTVVSSCWKVSRARTEDVITACWEFLYLWKASSNSSQSRTLIAFAKGVTSPCPHLSNAVSTISSKNFLHSSQKFSYLGLPPGLWSLRSSTIFQSCESNLSLIFSSTTAWSVA